MKLLLVDDNLDALELYSSLFRRLGFDVRTARDGLEGLTKFESFAPDVVVTDYLMPVLDGLQFVRALRQAPVTPRIVVFTASPKPTAQEWKEAGADLHFLRPTEMPQLFTTFAAFLDGGSDLEKRPFMRGTMEAALSRTRLPC